MGFGCPQGDGRQLLFHLFGQGLGLISGYQLLNPFVRSLNYVLAPLGFPSLTEVAVNH
jgi:hypothetical protein